MAYDFSSGTGEEEVTDVRLTRLAHSLAHTNVEQSDDCCYDDYWEEPTLHLHINHVEVNVDEEDGWISDPELCAPVQLPPEGEIDPTVCLWLVVCCVVIVYGFT